MRILKQSTIFRREIYKAGTPESELPPGFPKAGNLEKQQTQPEAVEEETQPEVVEEESQAKASEAEEGFEAKVNSKEK